MSCCVKACENIRRLLPPLSEITFHSKVIAAVLNMNVKKEQICRLCLKVTDNDYEIVDAIKRKMIEALLLKADLDVSKDPVICKDCAEILRKCFDFKTVCMNTEQIIVSFAGDENGATFELKNVFNPSNDRKDVETGDDNLICRFCSNRSSESNFVLLDTLMKDIAFAKMQVLLMPEMNFDVVKNPVICISCKRDLDRYMKFAENCSEVERKITKYCQNAGTPTTSRVVLNEVLRYLSKNFIDLDYMQINGIKKEKDEALGDIGEERSEAYYGKLIKIEEELDIKEHLVNLHEAPCETPIDIPEYKLYIPYGLKTETEVRETWTQDSSFAATTSNYGERMCDTITHHCGIKRELESNTVSSETGIKKDFKTKSTCAAKNCTPSIKNLSEAQIFNCASCTYATKQKGDLKKHTLVHKNVTEVEIYKCSMCTFETKRKTSLKTHTLIHKHVTEVEMYKCSLCTYATKKKGGLKRHTLIHKNIAELELYKCSACTYETKQKADLKKHTLIHKHVTEVEMYKCSMCTFQTKHKTSLKSHALIHKDVTEAVMYKCSLCSYETKQKADLRKHTLIHRDITEVELYKCSKCTFQTKHKTSLKTHMLIHKNVTEVEMHKCSECTYETKHKCSLKYHMLMHKQITEVEMYKCSKCSFQTKHNVGLKSHMLIHKHVTEVEMYKCSECSFNTKHKGSLKRHILTHKQKSNPKRLIKRRK